MAKTRRRARPQQSSGPNWLLIGTIGGFGVIGLLALLIGSLVNPPEAPEPTPVLTENYDSILAYCEANPDRCGARGNPDAEVTLVEISDYGCPHCRDFNVDKAPALQEAYVDSGQVRWVVFPYALSDQSRPSAEAALCAIDQGEEAFFDFHENLFSLQNTGSLHQPAGFSDVARRSGLDVDALDECVDNGTFRNAAFFNQQMAGQVRVNSTPTFFINGERVEGNQPLEVFETTFDRLLGVDS